MSKIIKAFATLLLGLGTMVLHGQSQAFIENKGQWTEDFDFKLQSAYGGVFLKNNAIIFNLAEPVKGKALPERGNPHPAGRDSIINYHAYRVDFLGAASSIEAISAMRRSEYHNYILGKDPGRWQNKVGLYEKVTYPGIYPGISISYYFNAEGNMKYDLLLAPGANSSDVQIQYTGADDLKLIYGNLVVYTTVEDVLESAPYAYQLIKGQQVEVECSYILNDNVLSFALGEYDKSRELVIDPVLIFSSYSGSLNSNFGYTATYGQDGSLYGGGTVFGITSGYPVTMGAFQDTIANTKSGLITDIAISKFTPDGSGLIYSTYLGGDEVDMPYSLLEGVNKELHILGNTGSRNFPVTQNAFDTTLNTVDSTVGGFISRGGYPYNNNVDLFICKLDSTGGNLLGSTYLGGQEADGINHNIRFNYGDDFRGDLAIDTNGNILGVSSTFSIDFPISAGAFQDSLRGLQEGVVFSLTPDLTALNWSSYLGGQGNDALFSLKLNSSDQLFVTGATNSIDIGLGTTESYNENLLGEYDGMVTRIEASSGTFQKFTYLGTTSRDFSFLVDLDDESNVYLFGQTKGSYPIKGNKVYLNQGSTQFLQILTKDLDSNIRSTVIGSGSSNYDISPTALLVDNCRNVYFSGWGGNTNMQGSTLNMPVTNNAFQSNSDGSDFYFMVLDATWQKINYATYFGRMDSQNGDHVDGGTSRFSKDGTIYQAVCAGCGASNDFPTTAGAYSRINGAKNTGIGDCNLGVIKFRIESNKVLLDLSVDEDSACVPYISNIFDKSYNADIILVKRHGGPTDTLRSNQLLIENTGNSVLEFIGIDTTCGFSDTLNLSFFGFSDTLTGGFTSDYDSCSGKMKVSFVNTSQQADRYSWNFGDGNASVLQNPVHLYDKEGTYKVTMIALNTKCDLQDTITKTLTIESRSGNGSFNYTYDPCGDDPTARFFTAGEGFQQFIWYVNGIQAATGANFERKFDKSGTYVIKLESIDSVCVRYFEREEEILIKDRDFKLQMPNVFTPNNDGINDGFGIRGELPPDLISGFTLRVFNRWGVEMYATSLATEFWDGRFEGADLPEGVYYYLVNLIDSCGKEQEEKGFVHLSR